MANESSIITPVRFSYDKQANPTAPLLVRDIAGAIYDINQTGALLTLKVADGLGSFENVEISLNHVSNAITSISTDATISGSHTPQDPLRVTTPLNRENLYGILNQSGNPMLVGGDNITITPSDGSENFTINSTGGTGGLDVDAVDARFVGSEFPADPKTGQTFYLNDVYIFNEIIYSAGWYRWSGTAWIRVKNVGFTIGGNFPTDAFEGHWHRPDVEIEIGDITYAPNKIYEKEGTAWNEVFFGDTVDSPEDIENRATFTLDADDFFPAYKRTHTTSDHITYTSLSKTGSGISARQNLAMVGNDSIGLVGFGYDGRTSKNDMYRYEVSGTKVDLTLLTAEGDVPSARTGLVIVGTATTGLIGFGQDSGGAYKNDVYRYAVSGNTITYTALTNAGAAVSARWFLVMVGDATSGLIGYGHDGSNDQDDIYSYAVSGTTITFTTLTKSGATISARELLVMVGTKTSGLIGFGSSNAALNDMYRYVLSSTTITFTALTAKGDIPLGRWDLVAVGNATSGLLGFGNSNLRAPNYNEIYRFAVSGDDITYTLLTSSGATISERRGLVMVGNNTSGLIGFGFGGNSEKGDIYKYVDGLVTLTAGKITGAELEDAIDTRVTVGLGDVSGAPTPAEQDAYQAAALDDDDFIPFINKTPPESVYYGLDISNDYLATFNLTTGVKTRVGSATNFGLDGSFNTLGIEWHQGKLYITNTSTQSLYTVNLTTGVATRVGKGAISNLGTGESVGGLASDGTNLYMSTIRSSSSNRVSGLYILNTTTATATKVGTATNFGVSEDIGLGIGFHKGILYMVGGSNDILYTVNLTTSVATRVGSTASGFGVGETHANSLFSDGTNLYMVGTTSKIYTLNTTTGAATELFSSSDLYTIARVDLTSTTYTDRKLTGADLIKTIKDNSGVSVEDQNNYPSADLQDDDFFTFQNKVASGTMYLGITNNQGTLTSINKDTAAISTIGDFGASVTHLRTLTFHKGELYGIQAFRAPFSLWKFNLTTGAASLVGTFASTIFPQCLASDGVNLFTISSDTSSIGLFTIDFSSTTLSLNRITPNDRSILSTVTNLRCMTFHKGKIFGINGSNQQLAIIDQVKGIGNNIAGTENLGINTDSSNVNWLYPTDITSDGDSLFVLGRSNASFIYKSTDEGVATKIGSETTPGFTTPSRVRRTNTYGLAFNEESAIYNPRKGTRLQLNIPKIESWAEFNNPADIPEDKLINAGGIKAYDQLPYNGIEKVGDLTYVRADYTAQNVFKNFATLNPGVSYSENRPTYNAFYFRLGLNRTTALGSLSNNPSLKILGIIENGQQQLIVYLIAAAATKARLGSQIFTLERQESWYFDDSRGRGYSYFSKEKIEVKYQKNIPIDFNLLFSDGTTLNGDTFSKKISGGYYKFEDKDWERFAQDIHQDIFGDRFPSNPVNNQPFELTKHWHEDLPVLTIGTESIGGVDYYGFTTQAIGQSVLGASAFGSFDSQQPSDFLVSWWESDGSRFMIVGQRAGHKKIDEVILNGIRYDFENATVNVDGSGHNNYEELELTADNFPLTTGTATLQIRYVDGTYKFVSTVYEAGHYLYSAAENDWILDEPKELSGEDEFDLPSKELTTNSFITSWDRIKAPQMNFTTLTKSGAISERTEVGYDGSKIAGVIFGGAGGTGTTNFSDLHTYDIASSTVTLANKTINGTNKPAGSIGAYIKTNADRSSIFVGGGYHATSIVAYGLRTKWYKLAVNGANYDSTQLTETYPNGTTAVGFRGASGGGSELTGVYGFGQLTSTTYNSILYKYVNDFSANTTRWSVINQTGDVPHNRYGAWSAWHFEGNSTLIGIFGMGYDGTNFLKDIYRARVDLTNGNCVWKKLNIRGDEFTFGRLNASADGTGVKGIFGDGTTPGGGRHNDFYFYNVVGDDVFVEKADTTSIPLGRDGALLIGDNESGIYGLGNLGTVQNSFRNDFHSYTAKTAQFARAKLDKDDLIKTLGVNALKSRTEIVEDATEQLVYSDGSNRYNEVRLATPVDLDKIDEVRFILDWRAYRSGGTGTLRADAPLNTGIRAKTRTTIIIDRSEIINPPHYLGIKIADYSDTSSHNPATDKEAYTTISSALENTYLYVYKSLDEVAWIGAGKDANENRITNKGVIILWRNQADQIFKIGFQDFSFGSGNSGDFNAMFVHNIVFKEI